MKNEVIGELPQELTDRIAYQPKVYSSDNTYLGKDLAADIGTDRYAGYVAIILASLAYDAVSELTEQGGGFISHFTSIALGAYERIKSHNYHKDSFLRYDFKFLRF